MGDHVYTKSQEADPLTTRQTAEFELDRSFRGPLLAYFLKRVKNRNEAEDLTQEVFIRLLNHRQEQRPHPQRLRLYDCGQPIARSGEIGGGGTRPASPKPRSLR